MKFVNNRIHLGCLVRVRYPRVKVHQTRVFQGITQEIQLDESQERVSQKGRRLERARIREVLKYPVEHHQRSTSVDRLDLTARSHRISDHYNPGAANIVLVCNIRVKSLKSL